MNLNNIKKVFISGIGGIGTSALARFFISRGIEVVGSDQAKSEITEGLEELSKPEKKELGQFCKVYAMKKALKQTGIMVDYSEIEIPGMKRIKKKKV